MPGKKRRPLLTAPRLAVLAVAALAALLALLPASGSARSDFGQVHVTITLPASNTGKGYIRGGPVGPLYGSSPSGLYCPGNCSATYRPETDIQLFAGTDYEDTSFRWGGDCADYGTSESCTVSGDTEVNVIGYFTDERPGNPDTSWLRKPPALVRRKSMPARLTFAFRSTESYPAFHCKKDARPWRLCFSPKSYSFYPGQHRVRVRARDSYGNVDPTPISWSFRVVKG